MGPFSFSKLPTTLIADAVAPYFKVLSVTEVERSQVFEVGPAEVEAPLVSDAVVVCLLTYLQSLISSWAFYPASTSLSWTPLRIRLSG